MTSGMPTLGGGRGQLLAGFLFLAAAIQVPATEGPVAWWKFEAQTALESVNGTTNELEGNYRFMPKGVRGGCLRFDGFTNRAWSAESKSNQTQHAKPEHTMMNAKKSVLCLIACLLGSQAEAQDAPAEKAGQAAEH